MARTVRLALGYFSILLLASGSILAFAQRPNDPQPKNFKISSNSKDSNNAEGKSAADAKVRYEKVSDTERIYNLSLDDLWMICVHAANQNFSVDSADRDKGAIQMHTGVSLGSNGFQVSVAVEKIDGAKTRLKVNSIKTGKAITLSLGSNARITEKYFKRIDELLDPKL
jgi:hypothetical protein